jgi:geranylgeranyl transferase type-2 subunit beta
MTSYLSDLHVRLADGLAHMPADFRQRHAAFLAGKQNDDGGFSGREGPSDLYYTGFGLRGLAALDALTAEQAAKAASFLRTCLTGKASVVDFYSFLYSCLLVQAAGGGDVLENSPADWPQRVAQTLETFRTPDGGYNKSPGATGGSTYHTFLVGLCYEMLGEAPPEIERIIAFIRARRRDDGGFVEVAPMRRSGTNPTAAAIGTLQLLQDSFADLVPSVVEFLAQMPSDEGGLRANDRVPLADLLSTFTGSWTLAQLGALDRVDRKQTLDLVRELEMPGGGFKGGLWDETTDVEYTFYGLGVAALLHA